MRELKSLDLHSKDPFPLPESGRGKANQINILTNSCQMVKFFFASSSNCFLPQRYQKTRLDWIRIQWSILPSQTSGRWTTTTPGLSPSQRIDIQNLPLGKDKWLSTDVPAWAVWAAWVVWAALKLTGKTRYRRAQVRQGFKLLTSDVEHIV